ncbi:putative Glutamine-dependent NAD(+) synthetase [Cocos nucifera]|nr:putative Glutamine-dependent NAD(+) synthetase [Cocos nucifera]
MRLLKVATCNLNQWAMDFDTNQRNIKESISQAKEAGAAIRMGPELEITGYGCEDHFLEQDTVMHSWECLKDILSGDWTENILCSIGMPIIHESVRYNCQVFCLNRRIVMIRPKMCLANDGNYREFRWFSAWAFKDKLIDFQLPTDIAEAISQNSVPFGYGYIQLLDASVAAETCEELFTADAPRIALALNGVEVFMNASGSHHQLRKLNLRLDAIKNATRFCGGVYMYNGCSCIAVNGDVVAQGSQFSLKDVEVLTAQVDLDVVDLLLIINGQTDVSFHQILKLLFKRTYIENGDEQVKADALRIGQYKNGEFPTDSKEFAKRIFYTVYMGTENSSEDTRSRAKKLADEIGSWHLDVPIDSVVSALLSLFQTLTGKRPHYKLDEVDMGMTYEELSIYGRLRKIFRCGPVSMFQSYSPEDNRFDLRQFLYNSRWPYQFRKIDELVQEMDGDHKAGNLPELLRQGDSDIVSGQGSGMGVVAAGSGNPNAGR